VVIFRRRSDIDGCSHSENETLQPRADRRGSCDWGFRRWSFQTTCRVGFSHFTEDLTVRYKNEYTCSVPDMVSASSAEHHTKLADRISSFD
jgi:hypothetical protein